jgi:putative SOS response-associated peptidase YedK
MQRFLVVRSGFFERHGWVMKEATIFSWEDVPTRTTAGMVHGNEVWVYGVTTEAKIMIPVQAKPYLLEYMDLQMVALDEERLRNDLDAY